MMKAERRQRIAGRILTSGSAQELDRQELARRLAAAPAGGSAPAPVHGAVWAAGRAAALVLWIGWRIAPRRLRVR